MNSRSICMIAYANYYTDARIQNYVDALLKRGYQVDVFALGSHHGDVQPGVHVFSVMEKYWGDSALRYVLVQLWFAWLVTWLVAWHYMRRHYLLIHVHNMPNFLVFSAIVPKLAATKIILDVHDTMPEAYATKFDVSLGHPLITLLRWEERLSARLADQVITTNELHKEVLALHGIPRQKIEIIMNVGNDRLFRPIPRPVSQNPPKLTLVYHGTIAERLGLDLILRAVSLASKEWPYLELLLIGGGDYLPVVKTLVEDLHLSDQVHLMGFIPVEELPTYLAQADVGVVGNRAYIEARQNYMLPVKMLEYAAMEIPTIAPRLRIICRYFDQNSTFFYTADDAEDMARRIVELGRNRQLIADTKQHLRAFNQRYNWASMESQYLDIVARLLSPHVSGGAQ